MDRCGGPSDPAVNSVLRQPGWLIDESPVALRPVLADGLPFREANLRCLLDSVARGLSGCDNGRGVCVSNPGRRDRGDRIRTDGLSSPKRMLYQAELRPDLQRV